MNQRTLLLLGLFLVAGATTWLLRAINTGQRPAGPVSYHDPDYFMENFSTITMEEDGSPKNLLRAVYMAHYPDDDTTELLQPVMEIYRNDRQPVFISAEQGWVTSGNEVILLRGNVRLWEDDADGNRVMQVETSAARVLVNEEYAETDQPATIVSGRSTISGSGMRAFLKDSRLEVLRHERSTLAPATDG